MEIKIIDTHIHIWNLSRARYAWLDGDTSILNRTYELQELLPSFQAAGVWRGVLVQAANNAEDTHLMLEAAAQHEQIAGVVGWLPLMDPVATQRLLTEQYLHNKYFKGVRHLIHNEPDPQWLLQPEVLEGLAVLEKNDIPYDIVGINHQHLEAAIEVAEKLPGLRLVLDHLNQPPISARERFGRWGELMKAISANPNVSVKISGLGTAAGGRGWKEEDVEPYIEFVLQTFGSERCFCGGDWPVSLLAGDYEMHWAAYRKILSRLLDAADLNKVLHDNACAFYHLNKSS